MDDLVNTLVRLQEDIYYSGVMLRLEDGQLYIDGPAISSCLRIVRLYRPSSQDIAREAAPDALLVLKAATPKAIQSAIRFNHIALPNHGYRIVLPGLALLHDVPLETEKASRQVRLTGRTGVIVESLLLVCKKEWSVRALAEDAQVAPALAHRLITRLERDALLVRHGEGPKTTRVLSNPRALAELWSQEEQLPKPVLRGFLYANSIEALAQKIFAVCPGGAVGGTLAANLYRPVLTRVSPPLRMWIPGDFAPEALTEIGFQKTDSGANIEFMQGKEDVWRVHMRSDGLPRVSEWRAWLEIANREGRTQELAETLLSYLE